MTSPDPASPTVAAAAAGHRVEDLSQRTAHTRVYANPDGTWTSETTTEPTSVQDDAGQWHDIDTTLVERDGVLEPRYAATDLSLSSGGDATFASLSADGQDMDWRWPTTLPAPTVEANVATYADAVPGGGDLVVTATPTGFRHDIVLHEAPDTTAPNGTQVDPSWTIPVATHGADLKATDDGGLAITATATGADTEPDETLATAPAPVMYDAANAEAAEPAGAGDGAGNGTTPVVPADTVPVETAVGETTSGTPTLTLTADADYLTDPDTAYPVTIDPTFTVETSADTWIDSSSPATPHASDPALKVGDNNGSYVGRALIRFGFPDEPPVVNIWGRHIISADLKLQNYGSNTCTASAIQATRISEGWGVGSATWDNQPAVAGASATYSPAQGHDGCPAGQAIWDVTDVAAYWAANPGTTYGIRLKAANETDPNSFRLYRAQDFNPDGAVVPKLVVTYTDPPTAPSNLSVTPCAADCDPEWTFTTSQTPTLQATSYGDDSSVLAYSWQLRNQDTQAVVATGTSSATSGAPTQWTVPPGTLEDEQIYEYRVGASNGTSSSWSDWTMLGVDFDRAPQPATDLTLGPCTTTVDAECSTPLTSTSAQPVLSAAVSDPDSSALQASFEVRQSGQTAILQSGTVSTTADSVAEFSLLDDALSDGLAYEFRVGTNDDTSTVWSPWATFDVAKPEGATEPVDLSVGPTAQCEASCPELAATSLTPVISARNPGAQPIDMTFQIADGDNDPVSSAVSNVAPGASGSWTVPSGVLGDSTYQLRVGATGTDGSTTWSAWRTLDITADSPEVDFPTVETDDADEADADFDPNWAPDPAKDAEDQGPVSTYDDTSLAALDADMQVDLNKTTTDGVYPDDATAARKIPIPLKYAPKMWIHPNDKDNPLSATTFINHSNLGWAHDHFCNDDTISGSPSAAKMGSGNYSHRVKSSAPFCNHNGTYWSSTDPVAVSESGGPGGREGMRLDLANSAKTGYTFEGDEPVYYDYHPNSYIQYWFLWGQNYVPPLANADVAAVFDHHEGDWEHISIKLDSTTNSPKVVQYHFHEKSCTLPWGKAPKTSTHPKIWFALGGHGSYPAGIKNPPKLVGSYHDSLSGAGPVWYGTANLKNVRSEPWWGFRGNWGRIGKAKVLHNDGPTGPSIVKDAKPTFATAKCGM